MKPKLTLVPPCKQICRFTSCEMELATIICASESTEFTLLATCVGDINFSVIPLSRKGSALFVAVPIDTPIVSGSVASVPLHSEGDISLVDTGASIEVRLLELDSSDLENLALATEVGDVQLFSADLRLPHIETLLSALASSLFPTGGLGEPELWQTGEEEVGGAKGAGQPSGGGKAQRRAARSPKPPAADMAVLTKLAEVLPSLVDRIGALEKAVASKPAATAPGSVLFGSAGGGVLSHEDALQRSRAVLGLTPGAGSGAAGSSQGVASQAAAGGHQLVGARFAMPKVNGVPGVPQYPVLQPPPPPLAPPLQPGLAEVLAALVQAGANNADGGQSLDSVLGPAALTRGNTALQRLHQLLRTNPGRLLEEFEAEVRLRLGVQEGEGWTLMQYARTLFPLFGTHKGLKKFLVVLAWLYDQARRDGVGTTPEGVRTLASLAQSFKVIEHAGRNNGDWGLWRLLPVPDPEGPTQSSAAPMELSALVAARREEAALGTLSTGHSTSALDLGDSLGLTPPKNLRPPRTKAFNKKGSPPKKEAPP